MDMTTLLLFGYWFFFALQRILRATLLLKIATGNHVRTRLPGSVWLMTSSKQPVVVQQERI